MNSNRLVALLIVCSLLAGCASFDEASTETPSPVMTESPTTAAPVTDSTETRTVKVVYPGSGGSILVEKVNRTPPNATVTNATDPSMADAEFVRSLLSEASERRDGDTLRELNETELERVEEELEDVPFYRPEEPGESQGYYIRYEGEVYRVLQFYEL